MFGRQSTEQPEEETKRRRKTLEIAKQMEGNWHVVACRCVVLHWREGVPSYEVVIEHTETERREILRSYGKQNRGASMVPYLIEGDVLEAKFDEEPLSTDAQAEYRREPLSFLSFTRHRRKKSG